MKKQRSIIVWLILSVCLQQAKAQIGKFYSTDRELSNSLINNVYQDKRGFIWVATEDGLNKFDGNKFTIYKHNPNDTTTLAISYIRSVFEDSQNRFWVLCLNTLQQYKRDSDSFHTIPLECKEGVIDPHINTIIERKNKEIWISTIGQGIMSLQNGRFVPVDRINTLIGTTYVENLYEDKDQNIWITTKEKGVFRYSPDSHTIVRFIAQQQLTSEAISSFCEDRTGQLFIGTINGGLMRFDSYKMTFEPIPYNGKTDLNIKTLMTDSNNRLYIGTEGNGVKQYDRNNNRIVDCNINIGVFDLSSSKIHSILEDSDGNLWFGIFQKGLVFVPSMQNKFNYYGYKSFNKNNIGSNCVMAICQDKQGVTWVGTDNDGLYAIDDDGNRLKHFKETENNGSAPLNIMCLLEDSRQQLWVGSFFSGLAIVDKAIGKSRYIKEFSEREKKGQNERVFSIIEDRNNYVWVATYGSGLYKLSLSSQVLAQYKSENAGDYDGEYDRLCNDWINCVVEDDEGLLWIGTCNGLSCLDPETEKFINFAGSENPVMKAFIHSLLQDRDGYIWIGTSEGLYRFDKKEKRFVAYTVEQGLPSNVICGILEDNDGNLWVSTHQGISKLTTKTGTFVNYYASDGLQGNEFTRGAYFQDHRGKMYFGGTSGITSFFPHEITTQKRKLKVEITDFLLANNPIRKGDRLGGEVITDTLVMDATLFTLPYDHSSFSMEFSTMEYATPDKIIYQYKLEGLDNDWINTNPGLNRVTYTSLPPGKYTFLIRAKENDSLSDIRKATIVITPPWYQTWWALLVWISMLCAVVGAIIMYLLSRIRHKQELMERIHQEEINEAKLQYFINISHEIRTPMTLIISPLEKLIAEAGRDLQPTYLMIYRNAQRILRLINQLMDIRKIDKGQMRLKFRETDIVGFIDDLMQTFEYQSQKKNIRFTFEHKDKELKAWVDLNNFDKVLMNVFSNAFKYTPNDGEVTVKLTHGIDNTRGPLKRYFEITVADTGIGISPDEIERIFERFYQVSSDVSKSISGTGIGLHLSRSLVMLHHGTIKAESGTDGTGARFVIRLPMGAEHLRTDELENPEDAPTSLIEQEKKNWEIPFDTNEEQIEARRNRSRTRYKILIAEDDDEIRHYIGNELNNEFHISQCTNGKEAIDIISREKIDLIISDIMMPELDGIALCKRVKQNLNTSHIPIVLLTARSKTEDRIEGLEAGADAYIVKPFNTEVLRTTVFNLIGNRERLKGQRSSEQIMEEKVEKIERKSSNEILMDRIMKVINERISDPGLNVETLAATIGMSRVHMHRKLKELTNQSTKDFIRNIRLKQAATLLIENDLTVSEAAYATGFTNISHFSNSFREFYGVSPSEYKEIGNNPQE